MFGKPEWFSEKTFGWGLTPVRWQGWVYALVWLAVLLLPAAMFAKGFDKVPEALLWVGAGVAFLTWDVRSIVREIRHQAAGDVFVIDDDTDASSLATRNYDMHLRD